ncbi:glycoside hydrolase family 3 N-terminal domain-containing protein [Janthinobacterium sp. HLX7-2]|uniref:glycoside hydrolase family 3 protein n=1 Tax=Janthinobacterium sp. HLX7-2 TaxID=1259331 RepID=UPI003F1F1355
MTQMFRTKKNTAADGNAQDVTTRMAMPGTAGVRLEAKPIALGVSALVGSLMLAACGGGGSGAGPQPLLEARSKGILTVDGATFRDLNGNGKLDPYEDWRVPVALRVEDLLAQMTLEEKAGMMLIDTLNPDAGGVVSPTATDYVKAQKMTRFIFRSTVIANPVNAAGAGGGFGGAQVSPTEAAQFMNAMQAMAEATRLGIPLVFKSNARNHYDRAARAGINEPSGSFSEWPKEPGLAATRDMELIKDFAQTAGAEFKAIGLRGLYGYMADLSTEPRWYRVHETFSEDADLNAQIVTTLVKNLQGGPLSPSSNVAMTMKHFPGGGPQEGGGDPHYAFGKNQVYPAGRFGDHIKPFKAAIDAGVAAIMPYYGVPIKLTYEGVTYDQIGMSFSKQIVTDLLRGKLGFTGYVNSDTGIINDRAWGLEDKTVPERMAIAITAGTDVMSGYHTNATITDLVKAGKIAETRINESVRRLLIEQFKLGLFENPYVDASKAAGIVGNDAFRAKAELAQRKSIVLLQNQNNTLPLAAPSATKAVKLYTMGMNASVVGDKQYGYTVVTGDYDASKGQTRPAVPADTDYAVIRVEVTNVLPKDYVPKEGEFNLQFGGALPEELNSLSFTTMAAARSWKISPSLKDIQAVMNTVGAKKTILNVYFRQPFVLDEASGLKQAGGILAGFGVSDAALMDVLTGKFKPQGKLPFALANNLDAVINNDSDAPGYAAKDTLYPFGHGLSY